MSGASAGPDLGRASAYVLARLERELSPSIVYHSIAHTRDEVVPAAENLTRLEQVDEATRLLVLTAAWFHDLGFIVTNVGHEEISARMAAEVLPEFGYSRQDIEAIRGMIMSTKLPQSPTTHGEQIVADADLMILGAERFKLRNGDLRREFAGYGNAVSDEQWFRSQARFIDGHRYFTAGARNWLDAGKQRNLEWLLASAESGGVVVGTE